MRILLSLVLFVFAGWQCSSAHAFYAGADYMITTFEIEGEDFDLGLLSVKFGQNFNEYFAIEARAGFGVSDDSMEVSADGDYAHLDVEADYYLGLYLRGEYNFPNVKVYALAGVAKADITVDADASIGGMSVSGEASADDTDFSYGAGAQWVINEKIAIGVEYLKIIDGGNFYDLGYDVESFNFGLTYSF